MTVRIAHRALGRHKLRSILTMLGVIFGGGALVIGQGAQASVRAKIASLGADALVVLPGSTTQSGVRSGWGSRPTLRAEDAKAIQTECRAIAWATPTVRTGSQVVYANQNWATTIQGTGIEYPLIGALVHATGRRCGRRSRRARQDRGGNALREHGSRGSSGWYEEHPF